MRSGQATHAAPALHHGIIDAAENRKLTTSFKHSLLMTAAILSINQAIREPVGGFCLELRGLFAGAKPRHATAREQ